MVGFLSVMIFLLLSPNIVKAQAVEDIQHGAVELKEIIDIDENNIPENVVIKYDVVDGVTVPRYFEVVLRKEFGNIDSYNKDNIKYFKWNDEYFLKDVSPGVDPIFIKGTVDDHDVVYYEDNTRHLATKIFVNNSEEGGTVNTNFKSIASDEKEAFINNGILDNVYSDFIENIRSQVSNKEGFIAVNKGTLNTLRGDFVDNRIVGVYDNNDIKIGIIDNTGYIKNIEGNFINNTLSKLSSKSGDGAILYNREGAVIDKITGNFIHNASKGFFGGGSIINLGHIGRIEGDFIGNTGDMASGTVLYGKELGSIDYIKGDFINNYITAYNYSAGVIASMNIGTIEGNFIGNKTNGHIGAIHWSKIDYIKGDFIENSATLSGGALYIHGAWKNKDGMVIESNFIGNHAGTHGGAVINEGSAVKSITGNFIGNYVKNEKSVITDAINFKHQSWGGAISNDDCEGSGIALITGDFIGNYIESVESQVSGGAVANFYDAGGIIGTIKGDFIENYVFSEKNIARGGAYVGRAEAKIDLLEGDFERNYAQSLRGNVYGGAIFNEDSEIGAIKGNFSDNYAVSGEGESKGGAIYNNGTIKLIEGNFVNNEAESGGAIYNEGTISTVNASFNDNNNALYNKGHIIEVSGNFKNNKNGAIYNIGMINTISGDFIYNTAKREGDISSVIYNSTEIMNIINSNFINNYVDDTDYLYGGVIYSKGLLNIKADDGESIFSGNKVLSKWGTSWDEYREVNSAINTAELQVEALNNGIVKFDDSVIVDGHVTLKSDNTSEIIFNDYLLAKNGKYSPEKDSNIRLGKNAELILHTYNANDSNLIVDIEVDKEKETTNSGIINVEGDVLGESDIIVDSKNPDVYEKASTVFLKALNDNMQTYSKFVVSRVVGSPYMWDAVHNHENETEGSTWYLVLSSVENSDWSGDVPNDEENSSGGNENKDDSGDNNKEDGKEEDSPSDVPPTEGGSSDGGDEEETPPSGTDKEDEKNDNVQKPLNPIYTPEIGGYVSIPRIAIEQNRDIIDNVDKGINHKRKCSGVYCYGVANIDVNKEAWINVTYKKSEIKEPQEFDAKIKGVTFGLDIYRDTNNTSGIFADIRDGDYDLSGEGEYYSNVGSDITTNSYIGGFYYKHKNRQNWKVLGIAFIGKQSIDLSTKDSKVQTSTDALQYGASVEVAKRFYISKHLNLEPSLGIYYTGIDIDPISDSVGKTAEYDLLHYVEAEFGLKFGYEFFNNGKNNNIYVKPSIIQTFSDGGNVNITGLEDSVETCNNETLSRLEVGGEFSFTPKLSGYTKAGYTFGGDYTSYDVKAGISYEF